MHKNIIFLLIILTFFSSFSQDNNEKKIKGKIVDVKNKFPLKSANILNLNSVKGTVTKNNGEFSISAQKGDVLHISYIGYESIKLTVTNDLLKNDQLEIAIHEKIVKIKTVKIRSHNLIGVLAIDAKNVPNTSPTRVHINGLAQAFEIGLPQSRNYESPLAAIFNPIDFWYQKLGKKPKEIKQLKKLRADDDLQRIMEQKFDREIMLEYLDMSREELHDLLKDCNYSKRFIKKASDLQIVNAVIDCIEGHKTIKEGKVKKEVIHHRE